MIYEVTKKQMKDNAILFKCYYCEFQNLANALRKEAYSCGVYGWSCDYFLVRDIIYICVGYSSIGYRDNKTIEILSKYDNLFKKASYETIENLKSQLFDELLTWYWQEVRNHKG